MISDIKALLAQIASHQEIQLFDFCDSLPLNDVVAAIVEDALSYLARDPALHGSWEALLAPSSSFRATATYRLAHMFWTSEGPGNLSAARSKAIALSLSYAARRDTGIEIHPAAELGQRFVLDHGYGTVIGETVATGADCYILNGVTLGARGIAGNHSGRRHPILGNRVEIGSFACVLGAVTIGDDVFIGPHCIISQDVDANVSAAIKHPLVLKPKERSPLMQSV